MMKKKLIFLLISVLLAAQISLAEAPGKISGLVFMDYYYVANHHNENIEGKNGFWLRRVYFTYDHDLGSYFKIRFSPFDSTSPSTLLLAGFDFEVANDFNLMPNLAYVTYDDISSSDLYLKLTAYFRW